MASPVWFRALIMKTFPARFRVARLTRWPVVGRLLDWALFHGDDIYYLPADRVVKVDAELGPPQDLALPSSVAEHFVRSAGRRFIMNSCLCREAEGCKDYPTDIGCIFLGDSTKKINPRFGREATVEEAVEHLARAREAGLVHLVGRNKLDAVWMNAWPKDRLMTICHCCPCCCLWKVLPDTDVKVARKVRKLPGVQVSVSDDCVGCGLCAKDVCFVDAIRVRDGKAEISGECRGCGRCVAVCPNEAIRLSFTDPEANQKAVDRLSVLVNLD